MPWQSWVYFVLQQIWKLLFLQADCLGTLSEMCVVHTHKRVYRKTSEDLHYDYLRATQAYQLRQLKSHGCLQPTQSDAQGAERIRCEWSWQRGAQTTVRKVNGSHYENPNTYRLSKVWFVLIWHLIDEEWIIHCTWSNSGYGPVNLQKERRLWTILQWISS